MEPPDAATTQILAADDDELIRVLIAASLEPAGYSVQTLPGGEQLLALLESQGADLLIVDMHMQDMGGLDIAKQVRAGESQGEHLPILLLTGSSGEQEVLACLQAGVDDYLAKPFDPDALSQRVATLLDGSRLEDR